MNFAKKSFISALVFLFLTGLLIYVFRNDYFKISEINCEKDGLPCQDKDKMYLAAILGKNIFLINDKLEENLIKQKLPEIEKLKLEKKLPNKITVKLSSRQEFACLTKDDKDWFALDKNGFIMNKQELKPKNLTPIFDPSNTNELKILTFAPGNDIKSSLQIIKLLRENLITLDKIYILPVRSITLFLHEGVVATLSAVKDVSLQVDSLHFILRQSKIEGKLPRQIDLRFDKPVAIF